jgi:hypothetical protein
LGYWGTASKTTIKNFPQSHADVGIYSASRLSPPITTCLDCGISKWRVNLVSRLFPLKWKEPGYEVDDVFCVGEDCSWTMTCNWKNYNMQYIKVFHCIQSSFECSKSCSKNKENFPTVDSLYKLENIIIKWHRRQNILVHGKIVPMQRNFYLIFYCFSEEYCWSDEKWRLQFRHISSHSQVIALSIFWVVTSQVWVEIMAITRKYDILVSI